MLYTGKGDNGFTKVIGGQPLPKNDLRVQILGALDEAQAHLGFARALLHNTTWADTIERTQNDMRLLMSEIAVIPKEGCTELFLKQEHIERLETDLDMWDKVVNDHKAFQTPGETELDAHLHLARTIVRRAERDAITLQNMGGISNQLIIAYLNRLSSWIYALTILTQDPTKS